MLVWLQANWSVLITDAALILGGLAGLEKVLEQVFPNSSILKKIGSVVSSILGFLPKAQPKA